MKKNPFYKSVAGVLVLAALTGCTTTQEEYHYVNLSQVACTFQGTGNQPLTVSVITAPATWSAVPEASWVTAEKGEDGESLIISVADNTTESQREARITVSAGEAEQQIRIRQLARDNEFARFRRTDGFQYGGAMSSNGKYVGGFVTTIAPDDSFQCSPTIIDITTGQTYEFGPFPESLYGLHQTMCISNQGLLFMTDAINGGTVGIDINGNIIIPQAPTGYKFRPTVYGVSADGTYWSGSGQDSRIEEGGNYRPLLWTDGVAQELPVPAKNYRNEDWFTGVIGRGISANGKVMYGTDWDNGNGGLVYWKDGKVDWVGKDVRKITPTVMERYDGTLYDYNLVDGMVYTPTLTPVSTSGRWIAGSFRTERSEDKREIKTTERPAFYNTETETTTIIEDYGEAVGMYATDEGIAFIGLGSVNITSGRVYDLNTHTDLGTIQEWVYANYNIIMPEGYIKYISPDYQYVFGTSFDMGPFGARYITWYIAPPIAK